MDIKLKHRLVGACVILALAVFFLPMILDSEKYRSDIESEIPKESVLQSEDNENSQGLAAETGTLTINLEEDEPQKAIEKSTPDSEEQTTDNSKDQNSIATGEEDKASVGQVNSSDTTDSTDSVEVVAEEESQQVEAQVTAEDSNSGKTINSNNENIEKAVEQSSSEPPETSETTAQTVDKAKPEFKEQAWVIQIGSFSNKENATGLVAKLQTQGYRAYQRQSGEYSRVFVGPYPDQEAAEKRQPGLEKIIGTPVKLIEFDAGEH